LIIAAPDYTPDWPDGQCLSDSDGAMCKNTETCKCLALARVNRLPYVWMRTACLAVPQAVAGLPCTDLDVQGTHEPLVIAERVDGELEIEDAHEPHDRQAGQSMCPGV